MPISSLQVEKHVLSGIIKYPDTFVDISPFIKDVDFFDEIHQTIFLVIKSLFEKGERWDKVLLAEKIKNIGVTFKDDINIYDYIDNLSFIPITQQATKDAAKELIRIRIRRDMETMGQEIITFARGNGNLTMEEFLAGIDSIYGKKVNVIEQEHQPENLYDKIEEMVEERGNNPINEVGLNTPYPEFNRMYGGLRPGQVYAIGSRPGQGKSTFLENTAIKVCELNNTKAFVCDTEMSTDEIRWRAASAHANVNEWHVETGNWRKNQEMTDKVRASWQRIRNYKEKKYITHYHVADRPLEQVISMIRRWHHANVKKGETAIIIYDYLKLAIGDNISDNWKEYQAMGAMINRLKRLAEELHCVILTAIQLNRKGDGKDATDDSTAIAVSDRLQWLGAFIAIFRCKTLDEINRDGVNFGTHCMIPLKTRFQGRDAAGHHNLLRRRNNEGEIVWVKNFLNFSVTNFDVTEMGSLADIIAAEQHQIQPADQNPNDSAPL